ncbi:ERMES complex subunit mmm1 [Malassezia yamatoensis]|uniref:ERMES complex subunit mmm1 n=1 Tax=Malassezia yamatoensis TaxID=253288 RepID=A0AAJ5YWP4_9BASI|nr:ERMES complex subunit mmm1 [Malassezia yamatoensis]
MIDVPESLAQQRNKLLARTDALQRSLNKRSRKGKKSQQATNDSFQNQLEDLLKQAKYDMESHPPESLDWFNLLIAQTLRGYRQSMLQTALGIPDRDTDLPLPSLETEEKAAAKRLVEHLLNTALEGRTMNLLDLVTVTDIDLGNTYPAFTNARFRPSDFGHGLRLEVDFDYEDRIALGLDTKLLLNFPQMRFGWLALALCLRIERIAGTIGIEIGHEQGNLLDQEVRISLYPDFILEAHVSSLIGSKNPLQDIPKIEQLLVSQLHLAMQQRVVWPNYWSIPLPVLEGSGKL